MARLNISETQFVFAFFFHYIRLVNDPTLTFYFPSLRREGDPDDPGAGADLVINHNLFFQFKMSDYLYSAGAKEIRDGDFGRDKLNYFRFWVKNSPPSNQFNLLKNAASVPGNTASYIAPMFNFNEHESYEQTFYRFFRSTPEQAMEHVLEIDFDQFLGMDLEETDSHRICYNRNEVLTDNVAYLFSQPQVIKAQKFESKSKVRNESKSLKETLLFLNDTFELKDNAIEKQKMEFNEYDTISSIQNKLVAEHNIYWVPIIQNEWIRISLL